MRRVVETSHRNGEITRPLPPHFGAVTVEAASALRRELYSVSGRATEGHLILSDELVVAKHSRGKTTLCGAKDRFILDQSS